MSPLLLLAPLLAGAADSADAGTSAARATWHLWGDLALADPYFLALLPLALLCTWWGTRRAGRARARVPVLSDAVPRSARQKLLWLPSALGLAASVLVVLALARPVRANVEETETSEGVDIVLAVDRSGSMQSDDLEPGKSRLDVVKKVVVDFARRRTTDREGAADSVALLVFAHYPELLCPFTLDAGAIEGFLQDVQVAKRQGEDGTAIGVALAKAVAVLDKSKAKSKVVVLLTDGQNNVHDIEPEEAGKLAAEKGIKVYTIYSGRYVFVNDPFRGLVATNRKPDTSALEGIAKVTGGRFFRARDEQELEKTYAEIEKLERTPRKERRWEETHDLYPLLLLPALLVYSLAWISSATWARRVP